MLGTVSFTDCGERAVFSGTPACYRAACHLFAVDTALLCLESTGGELLVIPDSSARLWDQVDQDQALLLLSISCTSQCDDWKAEGSWKRELVRARRAAAWY